MAVISVTVVSNGHFWLLCLSDYVNGTDIMASPFCVSVTLIVFDFGIVEMTIMGYLLGS